MAGSGSGKSELLKVLILSHIKQSERTETVFLLDPHGDISSEVSRFKNHKKGDALVYLSLDLSPHHTFCINPLDIGAGRTNPQLVGYMAECLTEVFREIVGANSAITANMGTLLNAVLSVLLKREGSTLTDLQRFMRDEQNEDLVEEAKRISTDGQKDFFQNAFYHSSYSATKAALYTKIQDLLNSQAFYRLTVGESTVDIQELMNSKKTVIFNLSKGLIGQKAAPAFGRLIMGMVQGYSFARQTLPKSKRTPLFMYLDEFQNFITPSIETILAESRKYGIHLTLAQQFLGQDTSTALKGAILNNTAVKIAGTSEGTSLEAIKNFMNGVTKEEIQGAETGRFFVRVKPEGIVDTVLSENKAFAFRVTTAFLGNRYAMKPKQWERVKAEQIRRHYRPMKAALSDKKYIQAESYQKNTNNAEIEEYRHSKPFMPKY